MREAEILSELERLGREHLELDQALPLTPELRLVEDLGLDSLKRLTLAVEAENRFRVRLGFEEDESIETVGELVGAIRKELR